MQKNTNLIKSEQGITLIVLILTIAIIMILAVISINSGTESLDSTRLKGFYTRLEIVQKRVDDIATTNESYVDDSGKVIYLKEQGVAYEDLTDDKKSSLESIIYTENLSAQPENFRYFTAEDLETILDLSEIGYNVFIDFNNRIVIAEDGIIIGDTTYHVLENATYFVKQDTEKNKVQSLSCEATQYRTGKCKVIVTPINAVGNAIGGGYVKYKKTTTKYWEESSNTEIIVEPSVEYNIVYVDANKNSIEKTIKVEPNSDGTATVTEI